MNEDEIRNAYSEKYPFIQKASEDLKDDMKALLEGKIHFDRITSRAKGIDRFVIKSQKKKDGYEELKYKDPFKEIQDQIGIRIIVLYLSDVEKVAKIIRDYYGSFEETKKEPSDDFQFKYFGKHFILQVPSSIRKKYKKINIPVYFELQIKTVFQHAWGECEHDLNYKSMNGTLTHEMKRLIALASAQAWGSDKAFQDIIDKLSINKKEES